jgi:hypothetical protein
MDTPLQPSRSEIEELVKLIQSANNVGDQAVAFSAERLRVCVEVGERLVVWKKQIGHGQWETFAEQHFKDLTKHTRTRWQQLAIAKASGRLNLDDARGLRHAYVLAGILPDTAPNGNAKGDSAKGSYLVHAARLVAGLQHIDISKLSAEERSTLAQRLEPVIGLYLKLTKATT